MLMLTYKFHPDEHHQGKRDCHKSLHVRSVGAPNLYHLPQRENFFGTVNLVVDFFYLSRDLGPGVLS